MQIEKIEDNNKYIIKITNEKNKSFVMQYGGSDFYWIMTQYDDSNEFIVTEEDFFLYSQMQQLFKEIAKCDRPYEKTLENNIFIWQSEDYGLYENANKLFISFKDDKFIIKFYQNPNREFNIKSICPICFCLSGSKNQDIAMAFSLMFLEYSNYQNNISNCCKKLIK